MRKILATAVLACLFLGTAAPKAVFAQEEIRGKNWLMSFGMKTWINTWQTNLNNDSANYAGLANDSKGWTMVTAGPKVAVIPSVSWKYKRLLVSGSLMFSPDYRFPTESFVDENGDLYRRTATASRQEYDLNAGFFISRSIVLTMGFKGITEKFKVDYDRHHNDGESKVFMNGVTLGIAGSAPIGSGFSVYGSGAGGWMGVTYSPASSYLDNGVYESSEMGVAWKAPGRVPLSLTLGYKFQWVQTKINKENNSNYQLLPRNECTRGPMLGLNLVF